MVWGAFTASRKADFVLMEGKKLGSIYECVEKGLPIYESS